MTPKLGQRYNGAMYRAHVETLGGTELNAQKVVDFEAEELGNEEIRRQAREVARALGLDLSQMQALWLCATEEDAGRYAIEGASVQPYEVDGIILAEDPDGGFLVGRRETKDGQWREGEW